MKRSGPRLGDRGWLVALALVGAFSLSGCKHGVVLVVPDPCVPPTAEQVMELTLMHVNGNYPGVEAIVAEYEQHCCEDDALADRPIEPHCELLPDS